MIDNILENYRDYLVEKGYSYLTPQGKPSTATDYSKRVKRIVERENISITHLSNNIDFYIEDYGPTGNNSEYGKLSRSTPINALRRFKEFLNNKNV